MMTADTTLAWMAGLVSGSVVVQTVELLWLKDAFSADGIWRWSDLRPELGAVLGWALNERAFQAVLWARLAAAFAFPFFPSIFPAAVLFFSTLLICIRWRGTFNGGSDYMTVIVLGALLVSRVFASHPKVVAASLMYVGAQVCLSYFVAGLAKLRRAEWRRGSALSRYMRAGYYDVAPPLRALRSDSRLWLLGSWLVMAFEVASPMALFRGPFACAIFIGLALLFHLANAYALGLNRFLFAWAAALPALLFCNGILQVTGYFH